MASVIHKAKRHWLSAPRDVFTKKKRESNITFLNDHRYVTASYEHMNNNSKKNYKHGS